METTGGSMSGYWRTGRSRSEAPPSEPARHFHEARTAPSRAHFSAFDRRIVGNHEHELGASFWNDGGFRNYEGDDVVAQQRDGEEHPGSQLPVFVA